MKKVLIVYMFLSLSLVSCTTLAQQGETASTPTSTAPAIEVQDPAVPSPAAAAAEVTAPASEFTISRMEIAGSVENREPVGVAATFPASQETVYCFVELKDVSEDTAITFVWTLGANEMGTVPQQVKKSSRWRTWSSKIIDGMKGDWKVDVLDEKGAVIKSATFKVE